MQIKRLIVVLATAGCLASVAAPASAQPTESPEAPISVIVDDESGDESGDDEREESENEAEESSEIYETGVRPKQPKEFERAGLADRELTMPPVVVRPGENGPRNGPLMTPKNQSQSQSSWPT